MGTNGYPEWATHPILRAALQYGISTVFALILLFFVLHTLWDIEQAISTEHANISASLSRTVVILDRIEVDLARQNDRLDRMQADIIRLQHDSSGTR